MDTQIVVARYNENINLLIPFKDITIIYNKGNNDIDTNYFNIINLKNVGRESHTYLYHIVNNYDNLAQNTIFFQGNISDHKILDINEYIKNNDITAYFENILIEQLKYKIEHKDKWGKEYNKGLMFKALLSPYDWLKDVIGINFEDNINETKVIWGANFAVSKTLIKNKPKSFYQNILRYIEHHINPELGHYIERSWIIFFKFNFIEKNKIKYIFAKNNLEKYYNVINKYLNNNNKSINEIHIWTPIKVNTNDNLKIYGLLSINNYININSYIYNNEFYIDINGTQLNILIEFENNEDKFEIIFSDKSSHIKDINNKFIYYYENNIINNNIFTKINFTFNEKILIQTEKNIIFKFDNPNKDYNIKNIKIKNANSNTFIDYKHNICNNNNIKIFYCNNSYFDPKIFYNYNYINYYVEKINFDELITLS